MKEIKMEYSEYEAMFELIKEQQKIIEELKKEGRVVLMRDRLTPSQSKYSWFTWVVPEIISVDENLAKEYLQEEFNGLSKSLKEAHQIISSLQREQKVGKSSLFTDFIKYIK